MMTFTLVQKIAIWALPLIFAITLHEVAHGWVASWFGDQTAKLAGRLSLNPIKHIDPVGTVILPLIMVTMTNFIFGWAKPVPVDPRNMRNPRRDMAIVAAAGPLSNVVMGFAWGLIAKLGMVLSVQGHTWAGVPLFYMGGAGIMINAVLAVLNLLPFPPLDGGNILKSLLPRSWAYRLSLLEPYSFFILVLLLVSGALGFIIYPAVVYLVAAIQMVCGLS